MTAAVVHDSSDGSGSYPPCNTHPAGAAWAPGGLIHTSKCQAGSASIAVLQGDPQGSHGGNDTVTSPGCRLIGSDTSPADSHLVKLQMGGTQWLWLAGNVQGLSLGSRHTRTTDWLCCLCAANHWVAACGIAGGPYPIGLSNTARWLHHWPDCKHRFQMTARPWLLY